MIDIRTYALTTVEAARADGLPLVENQFVGLGPLRVSSGGSTTLAYVTTRGCWVTGLLVHPSPGALIVTEITVKGLDGKCAAAIPVPAAWAEGWLGARVSLPYTPPRTHVRITLSVPAGAPRRRTRPRPCFARSWTSRRTGLDAPLRGFLAAPARAGYAPT